VLAGLGYAFLHTDEVAGNLTPFAPFGFAQFPTALILVFWAFVGFELSTVPSGEVRDPTRTIPRALAAGMMIVTVFYLTTNFVVYALVPYETLAGSSTPLVDTATVLFGGGGAVLVAVGAMISVSGSNESDMLGSSRLGYAMAADGLLPHRLAQLHPRFRTPYVALIGQAVIAGGLTFVDQIPRLISFAVVNLAFAFLLCALALTRLRVLTASPASGWRRGLPIAGGLVAGALIIATSLEDKAVGVLVLALGAAVYFAGAPRQALPEVVEALHERERVLRRLERRRMRFLGALVGWLAGRRSPDRRR